MSDINILVFSPKQPARGNKAIASFDMQRLMIDGQAVDIPLDQIGITLGGFDHKQVFMFWHSEKDGEEGRWAISPASDSDLVQLMADAPPPLSNLLKNARKDIARQRNRSRFGLSALGLFLALPLILLAIFVWQSHNIAGWAAGHISIETEKQLGELAFKQATAGLKLRQGGLDADAVKEIGKRLTTGSKYDYQWYIADDKNINAFAVPGGYVVVNTGLIKAADSAEEVAGVLAHEVQHVELRHTLKNILHSLGLRALFALVTGDLSGSALGDMAANLSELKFGRDLESEADQQGLNALKKAGIAPQGMVSFFEKLSKQENGMAPPELLSTHPASEERMKTLQEMVKQEGNWPAAPLPYDWKTVRKLVQ